MSYIPRFPPCPYPLNDKGRPQVRYIIAPTLLLILCTFFLVYCIALEPAALLVILATYGLTLAWLRLETGEWLNVDGVSVFKVKDLPRPF